jgi:hypothetical protein
MILRLHTRSEELHTIVKPRTKLEKQLGIVMDQGIKELFVEGWNCTTKVIY